jgi:hypothetical protein
MVSWCFLFLSESHGLVTLNAAAGGGSRPLPVPAFGGPGGPPPAAAKVAQMHFASERPLSQISQGANSKKITLRANSEFT